MTKAGKKNNKFVESVKKGFADIKLVAEEGNYKLFLKQLAVIIVVFLGYRYCSATLQDREANLRGQIDAVYAQQNNEKEYLANKTKLLKLEPRFPDLSAKNDWLLRQLVAVFRDAQLTPKLGSAQSEDTSNPGFTVAGIPVTLQTSFNEFGRLLASFENRDEFLRVSEFTVTKNAENLGQNNITMRVNTIFPKEKIAKTMFKNSAVPGGAK